LGVTAYSYEFADRSATDVSAPVSFPTLAAHTAEIPFLFPLFHGATAPVVPLTAQQQRLSNQMVSYWTTFARTGTPNSPKSGIPVWPPYDAARDNYQSLKIPRVVTIAPFGDQHNCAFWDGIDEVPKVVVPTSR
jgi:para-nitrobenzyl esterase